MYFNAWDPTTDAFVLARVAVHANTDRIVGGLLVWRDGVVAHAYGIDQAGIPPTDWDVMPAGDLTVRMVAAGEHWAVQLADAGTLVHLEWEGLSAATLYADHPAGPLARAVGWGHYEQSCRVRGDLVLDGSRVAIDGYGQRDHSWGFQQWAGLHQWHWVSGAFLDGRAFNLCEVLHHDDTTSVHGYVHGPDGDQYVTAVDRDLQRDADGGAVRVALTLTRADGSTLTVTGERGAATVPVRPHADQLAIVYETPMRLDAGGVRGYGIYEQLVTEFD